jgi:hypothetical protein
MFNSQCIYWDEANGQSHRAQLAFIAPMSYSDDYFGGLLSDIRHIHYVGGGSDEA